MINYITLGTNDLERAAKFYDELLALVGGKRAMANERSVGWVGPKGADADDHEALRWQTGNAR